MQYYRSQNRLREFDNIADDLFAASMIYIVFPRSVVSTHIIMAAPMQFPDRQISQVLHFAKVSKPQLGRTQIIQGRDVDQKLARVIGTWRAMVRKYGWRRNRILFPFEGTPSIPCASFLHGFTLFFFSFNHSSSLNPIGQQDVRGANLQKYHYWPAQHLPARRLTFDCAIILLLPFQHRSPAKANFYIELPLIWA